MKLKLFLPVLLLFICQIASTQENTKLVTKDNTLVVTKDTTIVKNKPPVKAERRWGDGGVGIGLDYGGLIGAKATFYPIPYLGIFAAGGWELIALGWNVGVLGRLIPADLNVPFRSPEFYDQINQMKNDPQIKMNNSPIPIAFSIGYNIEF